MDALSDVLRAAHLNGGVFLQAEFTAPWCMAARVPPQFCAPFLGPTAHLIPYRYVVEGELHASVEGGQPQQLRSGELVLFPRNDDHLLGSNLGLPPAMAMKRQTVPAPHIAGRSWRCRAWSRRI